MLTDGTRRTPDCRVDRRRVGKSTRHPEPSSDHSRRQSRDLDLTNQHTMTDGLRPLSLRTSTEPSSGSAASSGTPSRTQTPDNSTPTRLKRLSLVAGRTGSPTSSGAASPSYISSYSEPQTATTSASTPGPITPLSPLAASPLRRKQRPSSISYSPRSTPVLSSLSTNGLGLGLTEEKKSASVESPRGALTLADQ